MSSKNAAAEADIRLEARFLGIDFRWKSTGAVLVVHYSEILVASERTRIPPALIRDLGELLRILSDGLPPASRNLPLESADQILNFDRAELVRLNGSSEIVAGKLRGLIQVLEEYMALQEAI